MDSTSTNCKPHVVCVPYPAQGHVNPLFQLAKLLHHKNFHITFVNTEYNHKRLLNAQGPNALVGLPDFQFKTFSDGLPFSDANATQDIPSLCDSLNKNALAPFLDLLSGIVSNRDLPPVTCIVADAVLTFALDAADQFGIPKVAFWTPSACGVLGYSHYGDLLDKGLVPLKDLSYLTNGDLETAIDWIPAMKNIRFKDLPSFCRTTDKNDIMFNYLYGGIANGKRSKAVILNTFDVFEKDVLDALSLIFPPIYTLGPLTLLANQIPSTNLEIASNLWKEEPECMEWLDSKEPNSVMYLNFGSIAVISEEQMVEFAWGLANSNKSFLWVVRPDLVVGEKTMLPSEFLSETKGRGILARWCNQEKVLKHRAVGGFLSHMGWNSTLDSICGGVPMICWPFFAEQMTNSWLACGKWGIGIEMDSNVKREQVEKVVREMLEGEKGKELKRKAMEWKTKAEEATKLGGSSHTNLEKLVTFFIDM